MIHTCLLSSTALLQFLQRQKYTGLIPKVQLTGVKIQFNERNNNAQQ